MSRHEQLNVNELSVNEVAVNKVKLGGDPITVSASDINATCNRAVVYKQVIASASAISSTAKVVNLQKGAGDTFAITLEAPNQNLQYGQVKVIQMTLATANAVTLALTNVMGGSAAATATFDAVGETLILVGGVGKWVVVKETGVTLS